MLKAHCRHCGRLLPWDKDARFSPLCGECVFKHEGYNAFVREALLTGHKPLTWRLVTTRD